MPQSVPEGELDWAFRRAPRACNLCRKKKVRCDGAQPACAQCLAHRSQCTYLPLSTHARPRPRRPKQTRKDSEASRDRSDQHTNLTFAVPPSQSDVAADSVGEPPVPPMMEAVTAVPRPNGDGPGISVPGHPLLRLSDYELQVPGLSPHSYHDFSTHFGILDNGTPNPHSTDMLPEITMDQAKTPDCLVFKTPDLSYFEAHGLNQNMFDISSHLQDPHAVSLSSQSQNSDRAPTESLDGSLQSVQPHSDEPDWQSNLVEEDVGHSLQRVSTGHMKYLGPTLSFIPATKVGQEWVDRVTGSTYFSTQIDKFLSTWSPDVLENILSLPNKHKMAKLPPYEKAYSYIDNYFLEVQCLFPVLDKASFCSDFNRTYESLSAENDCLWYAMVNVVLAIGCRLSPESSEDLICDLFENALRLLSNVILCLSSLRKVQTLTLMYLFLTHTSAPHWGSTILTCAVRESQALGLHLQPRRNWNFSTSELRQRSLLFWTLYCLDTHLTFRLGRQPLLKKNEISLQLPRHIRDNPSVPGGETFFVEDPRFEHAQKSLFIFNVECSHLLQDVSALVFDPPEVDILQHRVSDLEDRISRFCSTIPSEWVMSNGDVKQKTSKLPPVLALPVAVLNSSICLARWIPRLRLLALKAVLNLEGMAVPQENEIAQSVLDDLIRISDPAATLIRTVLALPKESAGFDWYLNPLPVFAAYVLFYAIIHQPRAAKSKEHMDLITLVVESTVQGVATPRLLIQDIHVTHFITFIARTARLAISRATSES